MKWQTGVASRRFQPFLSPSLDEYLAKYWAVMFTVGARPLETGHIRHYVAWYCTRMKVVELDHHLYADRLRAQLLQKSGTTALPLLFVNKRLVGTLEDVRQLEREKKLKDVLQFGFEWKVGGSSGKQPLDPLPSAFNDKELFRGQYRGAPVSKPVVQLPKYHPFHNPLDSDDS